MRNKAGVAIRRPARQLEDSSGEAVPAIPAGGIWSLRRGDADDNRTSPNGRGWRSLLVSSALEFNYAAATVAFVTLVLVPALLVGLMPPLVLTYGRQAADAATLVTTYPVWALLVLGVLLGAAIRFGRPAWSLASENFWHLHYSLVFPLFVTLRESISALLERVSRRTPTPNQLDRRRRIGTAVAAALLAGGSLVVVVATGVSTGSGDAAKTRAWPWAVAMAALANAVVVMAGSTAVASLLWFWREVRSRRPVRDWTPDPVVRSCGAPRLGRGGLPASGPAALRVAHLSDLHVVGERFGFRMECGTDGPWGNQSVRHALRELSVQHASSPIDVVLVTGDITDAGTRAEWIEFLDVIRPFPDLRSRMLLLPGNHDVNIVDRTNTGRLDLPWSTSRALRKLRFVLALDAIQGERSHLFDRTNAALGPSLRDYLREGDRPAALRALAAHGSRGGRRELSRVWEAIFPLVVPPQGPRTCGVVLLDSNAPAHLSLTNAIGVVSRSQLRALDAILRASPGVPWLIALHHHVVEYPIPSVGLQERIGLALVNAPDVLAVIAPHASRTLVLHGHRHRDWIGTGGGVVLCSAPSVSLGSAGPDLYRGSFHVHDISVTAEGELRLAASQHLMVA